MKKVTLIFASITMLFLTSCNDKKEVVEKTVVIEKEAAAPTVEEENDGTSINVSEDGVEFSTKDGENKTEVDINTKNK